MDDGVGKIGRILREGFDAAVAEGFLDVVPVALAQFVRRVLNEH